MNIVEAIKSPKLLKPVFRDLTSWWSWICLLKAYFGLQVEDEEQILIEACTKRKTLPEAGFKELAVIAGRRSGKSFIAAVIAVFLALFHDYKPYLGPGERGSIMIIAADKAQARVIFNYVSGILHGNDVFRQCILKELRERIELNTQVDIEILTCNFRTLRGRTVVAALLDEVAFWMIEGRNPDHEIISAIRPGMATIPTSKLILLSSPYAKRGVMYELFSKYFGKEAEDVLVWQAKSKLMNPSLDDGLIAREMEKDPVAAASEWEAIFRTDIESFVPLEWIQQAIIPNRYELPPAGFRYSAFADASGGAVDSFTLSIAHREKDLLVQDVLKSAKPPFDPYQVVTDYCKALKQHGCSTVTSDRYAGAWVSEAFLKHGIRLIPSSMTKSEIYLAFEPLLARGQVELLDDKTLFAELRGLERRTGRGRRDTVDHGPGQHDDSANSTAGVLVLLSDKDRKVFPILRRQVENVQATELH